MADNETQGQEDTAWWGFDDFADSSLPSATFDEPLVWPESPAWDGLPATGPEGESLRLPEQTSAAAPAEFEDIAIFPPEPEPAVVEPAPQPDLEVQWQATDDDQATTALHRDPLAGLGGGTNGVAPATAGEAAVEPLGESIWAETPRDSGDIGLISTSAHSTSPVYPATDGSGDRPWWRRVDVRSGNAAMIGLISLVSLVLLGMFLSVRARNEVPTDSSQTRRPSNDIAATGPLNTVPLTTTVTTAAPAPAINIADLLPPGDDAAAAPTESTTESTTGSTGSGARAPATTAAPARSSGGGGGGGGATTPATSGSPAPTSPPATSPPVQDTTPPQTSPPPTSPPVDDTPTPTPPTTRRTTTTFTIPSFPTTPTTGGSNTPPSFTIPTFPGVND